METLQWMPVGPLGIPHAALEDNVYEGCRIPKGASVIAVSTVNMLDNWFLISHIESLVSLSDINLCHRN